MKRDSRYREPNTVTESVNVFNDVTNRNFSPVRSVTENVNVFNVVTLVTLVTPKIYTIGIPSLFCPLSSLFEIYSISEVRHLFETSSVSELICTETVSFPLMGIHFRRDNRDIIYIYLIYIYKNVTNSLSRSGHGLRKRNVWRVPA
jgi:hypothetical protein